MGGQVMGDMLSAVGSPWSPQMPATSSAAKPENAKKAKADTTALQDAKRTLWVAATMVVVAIAFLGFGSKFLNNVRIA